MASHSSSTVRIPRRKTQDVGGEPIRYANQDQWIPVRGRHKGLARLNVWRRWKEGRESIKHLGWKVLFFGWWGNKPSNHITSIINQIASHVADQRGEIFLLFPCCWERQKERWRELRLLSFNNTHVAAHSIDVCGTCSSRTQAG